MLYRGTGTIALLTFPAILQLLTVPETPHVVSNRHHISSMRVPHKVTDKAFTNRNKQRIFFQKRLLLHSGFVTFGNRKRTFKRLDSYTMAPWRSGKNTLRTS